MGDRAYEKRPTMEIGAIVVKVSRVKGCERPGRVKSARENVRAKGRGRVSCLGLGLIG